MDTTFSSSFILEYRLSAPSTDIASGNLQTLINYLPFYYDDLEPDTEHNYSRDILSILPHGDVLDYGHLYAYTEAPEPSYSNVITVQEMRRLRRSRVFDALSQALSLDQFILQPYDIQLSILEFLHPLDLHNLSRASKSLRSFILGDGSRQLWRTSFERNAEMVPSIPDGVPVLRWLDLLFGPTSCDLCGRGNSFTDFTLRCRLCDRCRHVSVIEPRASLREFIATSWTNGSHKYPIPSLTRGKAPAADVLKMHYSMDEFQDQPEALAVFQAVRRKTAVGIVEHAEQCNAWRDAIESNHSFEWVGLRDIIITKLSKRLISCGYDPRDVEICQSDLRSLFQMDTASGAWIRNKRLTESMWQYVISRVHLRLHEIRASRLERTRRKRIETREADISHAYQAFYKPKLVSPWQWPELPPVFALFKEPVFQEMINAGDDDETEVIHLELNPLLKAFEQIAEEGWLEEWRWMKMRELASLLPDYVVGMEVDVGSLDRATAVYWCLGSRYGSYTAGRCLIGWEGSAPHLRCGALRHAWNGRLHYNEKGAAAARECVRMTGICSTESEINRVTAREMDLLDKRFICDCCGLKDYGDVKGRPAMTWRECVSHFIDKFVEHDPAHIGMPRVYLLSAHAEAHVKAREHPDPHAKDRGWSCNHCSTHCNRLVTRDMAIRHVKETHVMNNPVENLDYIYFTSATYRNPRNPITFQESPPLEFQCAKCVTRGLSCRMYCAGGIQAHLARKHDLDDELQLERDIVKITEVLYTEPPPPPVTETEFKDRMPTCIKS